MVYGNDIYICIAISTVLLLTINYGPLKQEINKTIISSVGQFYYPY